MFVAIYYRRLYLSKTPAMKSLYFLTFVVLINLIITTILEVTNTFQPNSGMQILFSILNAINFILAPITCAAGLSFIYRYINKTGGSNKYQIFNIVPIIFCVIVVAINIFEPIIFYINTQFEYYSYLRCIVILIYAVYGIILIATNIVKISKSDILLLLSYIILPLIASLIPKEIVEVSLVLPIITGIVSAAYIFFEGNLMTIDEVTGAVLRKSLIQKLEEVEKEKSKCSLIYLDLDYLKEINDKNGHAAGEQALKTFAKICMQNINGNNFLARYGGDDFIIFLEDANEKVILATITAIKEKLDEENIKNSEYKIEFSYTYGDYDNNIYEAPINLITDLEKKLYTEKNKRH